MISFFNNDKKHGLEDESDQTGQMPGEGSAAQDDPRPIEDDEFTIPVPPVAAPFYGLKDNLAYFGFSQRGKSHIDSGAPCQDRCYSSFISENKLLIVAVADGVGSCALSDLGADTAVHSSVEYIHKELHQVDAKKVDSTLAGTILRNALQYAYDQVELAAQAHEQLLYSLQSTLTVAIYNGTDLYFGHAGDDGIVVLTEEGTLAMATTRHKGEEASSVYPLQGKTTWQFGMVQNAVAFVMATDGVLDAFVRSSFEKDRVYYPFIEPIFTATYGDEENVKQICADLFAYMSGDKYRAAVTDDLTFAAVMNLDKLPHCLPKFDLDAWNEETKQYEDKVRSALYDQPQKLPHKRANKPNHTAPIGQAQMGGAPESGNQTTQPVRQQQGYPTPGQQGNKKQPPQAVQVPPGTQSNQRHHTTQAPYTQTGYSYRNPNQTAYGRRTQKPPFYAPYGKGRDAYYSDPYAKEAYYSDDHYGRYPDYDDGSASQPTGGTQYPNGRHGRNIPNGEKPRNHKKIRPQFIIFMTILALILVLLVYLGIKVVRFI